LAIALNVLNFRRFPNTSITNIYLQKKEKKKKKNHQVDWLFGLHSVKLLKMTLVRSSLPKIGRERKPEKIYQVSRLKMITYPHSRFANPTIIPEANNE
jgi:hypothetical protein